MAKFYIIEHEQMIEALKEVHHHKKLMLEAINTTCKEFGIDTHGYLNTTDRLGLLMSTEETNRLRKYLMKSDERQFKKSSPMSKFYVNKLAALGFNSSLRHMFNIYQYLPNDANGLALTIKKINDVFYMMITNKDDIVLGQGFKEIPGSKYYRIVEEYEKEITHEQ